MNKKGYTVVELIIVIALLGVATVVLIGKASYAFDDNSKELYKVQMKNILIKAKLYGVEHQDDIMKEEKGKVIKVSDLVKEKFLNANNKNGDVFDPRNKNLVLNDIQIKLSYNEEDKSIVAEYLE